MVDERALPGERQSIAVDSARWQQALPAGAWPDRFAETPRIWRRDVFAVADRWRRGDASATQLASAAMAWGHGIRGYGRSRAAYVLNQDPHGTRVAAALDPLRAHQPSQSDLLGAYETLFAGPGHLHRLGPAFFTKIIYFAGYRRGEPLSDRLAYPHLAGVPAVGRGRGDTADVSRGTR